jgi:hypothetical protein
MGMIEFKEITMSDNKFLKETNDAVLGVLNEVTQEKNVWGDAYATEIIVKQKQIGDLILFAKVSISVEEMGEDTMSRAKKEALKEDYHKKLLAISTKYAKGIERDVHKLKEVAVVESSYGIYQAERIFDEIFDVLKEEYYRNLANAMKALKGHELYDDVAKISKQHKQLLADYQKLSNKVKKYLRG